MSANALVQHSYPAEKLSAHRDRAQSNEITDALIQRSSIWINSARARRRVRSHTHVCKNEATHESKSLDASPSALYLLLALSAGKLFTRRETRGSKNAHDVISQREAFALVPADIQRLFCVRALARVSAAALRCTCAQECRIFWLTFPLKVEVTHRTSFVWGAPVVRFSADSIKIHSTDTIQTPQCTILAKFRCQYFFVGKL